MANIDLSKYGITGATEIVYNPSYEDLYKEETNPALEGYEKGQESELGAGGILKNITMITTVCHRMHGKQLKRSLRQSFLTRNYM